MVLSSCRVILRSLRPDCSALAGRLTRRGLARAVPSGLADPARPHSHAECVWHSGTSALVPGFALRSGRGERLPESESKLNCAAAWCCNSGQIER